MFGWETLPFIFIFYFPGQNENAPLSSMSLVHKVCLLFCISHPRTAIADHYILMTESNSWKHFNIKSCVM
jgi:hypothetical protein